MLDFSPSDFVHAFVLLLFIEGLFYLFIPKTIQAFAVRCLIDANPHNLRIFGALLVGFAFFLVLFVFPTLSE